MKLEIKIIQLTEKQNGMVMVLLAVGDVGVVAIQRCSDVAA